jgi:hypothetical protein
LHGVVFDILLCRRGSKALAYPVALREPTGTPDIGDAATAVPRKLA